jgi:hypothetical protein
MIPGWYLGGDTCVILMGYWDDSSFFSWHSADFTLPIGSPRGVLKYCIIWKLSHVHLFIGLWSLPDPHKKPAIIKKEEEAKSISKIAVDAYDISIW